jgi:hypothetical protein
MGLFVSNENLQRRRGKINVQVDVGKCPGGVHAVDGVCFSRRTMMKSTNGKSEVKFPSVHALVPRIQLLYTKSYITAGSISRSSST